ncbi:unnamed protein product [Phytomonas sp. EM1]|nr:unnamed protein product [Phytomonas sp. EM1]|eukprot:CCW60593.1 unnamed protein product [Phytomonas sp. isolate EM1]
MNVSQFIPQRRTLSPPKPPGTHTNDEVREALHTRALYRTAIVTLIVALLTIALIAITNTTQEIQDTASYSPKLLIVTFDGLEPEKLEYCMGSTLISFTQLLKANGGIYGRLKANYTTSGSLLVKLLTGSPSTTNRTLEGAESFLRRLKKANYRALIAAPARYWSSNQVESPSTCTRVGLFDSECTGMMCPGLDKVAYCNAYQKYLTCDGRSTIHANETMEAFRVALEKSADVVYVQIPRFAQTSSAEAATVEGLLELCGDLDLLDATLGMLVLSISERTKSRDENWLVIFTGDGDNAEHEAPLMMVAYSKGQIIQLNDFRNDYYTTDLYQTIITWFGLNSTANLTNVIGICTNGIKANNCKK